MPKINEEDWLHAKIKVSCSYVRNLIKPTEERQTAFTRVGDLWTIFLGQTASLSFPFIKGGLLLSSSPAPTSLKPFSKQ